MLAASRTSRGPRGVGEAGTKSVTAVRSRPVRTSGSGEQAELSIPNKKTEIFDGGNMTRESIKTLTKRLELEMDVAAANLDFEKAAH